MALEKGSRPKPQRKPAAKPPTSARAMALQVQARWQTTHEPWARAMGQWLLDMERKAFLELLNHPKTQERIMGMLQTGKPVRN